ncbi:alpha carbonic anhydrase 7 [Lathyrus oleraceus]|uniref:Alpha-carbonic anhydrase domain-containing protein n=1 Tax=Pisum sativum TaxID=3888 RepID=A0A9D4W7K4_PEA|nr:alpha carbonic anhydrase 7-like [Pisum sativum]KAI5395716.1 hypothetical protein KIW84_062047 [Pisum sativum]
MKHSKIVTKFHSNLPILVTILLLSTKWTIAQEVEDELPFDYVEGSKKGPSHWGELKKEWKACKIGKMQSPIDISSDRLRLAPKLGRLKINYKAQNATLKNRGHDIEVKWLGNAGTIDINGVNFFLHQAHWHSPAEHTINGSKYDVELHMVHESAMINGKTQIAVVGVLYKFGQPDRLLEKLSKHIKSMVNTEAEKLMGVINPTEFLRRGNKYYKYIGSLTVPPCTEGVIWIINKKIGHVCKGQVALLRDAVHDHATMNNRPLQLHNGRFIQYYDPKKKT